MPHTMSATLSSIEAENLTHRHQTLQDQENLHGGNHFHLEALTRIEDLEEATPNPLAIQWSGWLLRPSGTG